MKTLQQLTEKEFNDLASIGMLWEFYPEAKSTYKETHTFIYGGENTIHRTKLLNIEIDRWTGKVVSVWFRCLHLPFDVTSVDKNREKEMKRLYEDNEPVKINAIEVEK